MKDGLFTGILVGARLGVFGANNSEAVKLDFKVISDDDGALSDPVDAAVFLWTTGKAWPYTEEKLEKLGFNGDPENPVFHDVCYELGVTLACKNDTYNGKPQTKWDIHFGKSAPASADAVAGFKAKWAATHPTALKSRPQAPVEEEIPL